ncbi:hypothetical protein BV22DRAFT_1014255, partial [Leucogyrophana mollusca]
SKANLTCPAPFITGGSWKKSPVTITWQRVDFLSMLPILASLSNRSPSTIDTVGAFMSYMRHTQRV